MMNEARPAPHDIRPVTEEGVGNAGAGYSAGIARTTSATDFKFLAIPADDVRTKQGRTITPVAGLLDDANKDMRPEHVAPVKQLFQTANTYLQS